MPKALSKNKMNFCILSLIKDFQIHNIDARNFFFAFKFNNFFQSTMKKYISWNILKRAINL